MHRMTELRLINVKGSRSRFWHPLVLSGEIAHFNGWRTASGRAEMQETFRHWIGG